MGGSASKHFIGGDRARGRTVPDEDGGPEPVGHRPPVVPACTRRAAAVRANTWSRFRLPLVCNGGLLWQQGWKPKPEIVNLYNGTTYPAPYTLHQVNCWTWALPCQPRWRLRRCLWWDQHPTTCFSAIAADTCIAATSLIHAEPLRSLRFLREV